MKINGKTHSLNDPKNGLWLFTAIFILFLNGCATSSSKSPSSLRASFPLQRCGTATQLKCVAPLFEEGANIGNRDPKDFPKHYLELFNKELRKEDCKQMQKSGEACEKRLELVADYFNAADKRPADNEIGVALEGGGTKAASFSLGILAGLQELGILDKIGAISSISGGSYAASYYYNRWFDRLNNPSTSGQPEDWFNSCIPEYFIQSSHFDALRNRASQFSCLEKSDGLTDGGFNEFGKKYEYIGHVWKNHDLLLYDFYGNLRTSNFNFFDYVTNIGQLLGHTAPTIPFQFLARTLFRWPLNSAPSKLAYKLGLEREYGYSPKEWAESGIGNSDLMHFLQTSQRRTTRTLENFHKNLTKNETVHIPFWIIGSTAPTSIRIDSWLHPHPRDPLRQQFELTWNGYGSGAYGYARQSPDAPFDFLGRNPEGLPIVDAVVASASFFDDDQTQKSGQPFRLIAGAGQHFLNITWFSELRNFNQCCGDRLLAKILPWPSYFGLLTNEGKTPYIHLQDGGNTENSGIFPLLRRGYKTIIYAHGTEDKDAKWESICHLKNQLELDGTYFLRISENTPMGKLMQAYPTSPVKPTGRKFANHLDELCSSQLDDSDLAAFNEATVAKLYCNRLGYPGESSDCPEFKAKLSGEASLSPKYLGSTLFFNWRTDDMLSFQVYRLDSAYPQKEHLISTIMTLVPGVSFADIKKQLLPIGNDKPVETWDDWCSLEDAVRKKSQITYCYGPKDQPVSADNLTIMPPALSCNALTQVLDDGCTGNQGSRRPGFPQNSVIFQTFHTTYTTYSAYFDLARHQVRHAICNSPDFPNPKPDCSVHEAVTSRP